MRRIYLDYAATTPVKDEVLKEMLPYNCVDFGNPSSIHFFGQQTRHAIDRARENVARFLNCQPEEIIFTSGATEANNLVLKGIVTWLHSYMVKSENKTKQQFNKTTNQLPHVITSAIEHHSVWDVCKYLEKQGKAAITYLPVYKNGIVKVEDVKKAIKENTVLVSIMYINNEIGTVQPIREVGKVIEKENRRRLGRQKIERGKTVLQSPISKPISNFHQPFSKIYFHTDAVQAIEYFNCDVKYLHVDMLSLSAHKFGGPKGVGALYVKKGINLQPQIIGGGQENKKRAGTENVAGIVGLGKAIEKAQSSKLKAQKLKRLRDRLIDGILKNIPDVLLNGDKILRSPNNANFCFKFVEGESILLNLDLQGVAASSGSACTSGSLEPSHVLLALGRDHQTAQGSIRFTLGEQTTEKDIDFVLKILPKIVKKLRKMSPFWKSDRSDKGEREK